MAWIGGLLLTAVCCTTASLVIAIGPPQISSEYERAQLGRAGNTVRLICPVSGDPEPILQWSKDGENIHQGWPRYRAKGNELRIRNVTPDDAGLYNCKAVNGFGHVQVEYRLFIVSENDTVTLPSNRNPNLQTGELAPGAPQFYKAEQMESNLLRPVGSSVRMKCRATGDPRPEISWYKDGLLLSTLTAQFNTNDEDARWTLSLFSLQSQDTADYTCRVANIHGEIQFTFQLEVVDRLEEPIIEEPYPLNSTVHAGESAILQCRVHSEVQPTIQWLKQVNSASDLSYKNYNNSNGITVDGANYVVLHDGHTAQRSDGTYLNKLVIPTVRPADAGVYICLGANSVGYSYRRAHLVVLSDKVASTSEGYSLTLLIAIPVLVILGLVMAVLILVCHRHKQRHKTPSSSCKQRPAGGRMPSPCTGSTHCSSTPVQTQVTVPPSRCQYMAIPTPYSMCTATEPMLYKNYGDIQSELDVPSAPPPSVHLHYSIA